MQALVLVGGRGTRLLPLTADVPKPALPLAGRPFLGYMVDWLAAHGVDRIILACGFLLDQLRDAIGEGEPGGPSLTYVVEPKQLGTAGAMRFAASELGDALDDTFLALNGDILADLDLSALWQTHHDAGARLTLGLHPVEDAGSYGLVETGPDGWVTGFFEKQGSKPGLISAGTYVVNREVIEALPEGLEISIEHEVFPKLVGEGLYGQRLDGYWMDIGTPERFLEASWDILDGRVNTAAGARDGGTLIDPDSQVDPDAIIEAPVVIGPGCRVAAGARLTRSILMDGCEAGADSVVVDSIVSPGARVPAGGEVRGDVVGRDVVAEPGGVA